MLGPRRDRHRAGPARSRRPNEWARDDTPEPQPDPSVDLVADGLDDLATQLGARAGAGGAGSLGSGA